MSNKLTLELVLDEFAAAADRPSEALVREWTGKYPKFEREIVDFAVEWEATELATADAMMDAELEDRLVGRTMSHIQRVANQPSSQAAEEHDELAEALIQITLHCPSAFDATLRACAKQLDRVALAEAEAQAESIAALFNGAKP